MAMPPRMLPTATPMLPDRDALATIAISGRLVAIASRMRPPSAEPSPSRIVNTSVWSESTMPGDPNRRTGAQEDACQQPHG